MDLEYHSVRKTFLLDYCFTKKYSKEISDNLSLFELEEKANKKFLNLVKVTSDNKIVTEEFHLNALKYFETVQSTTLYDILYKMPKGGLLHHHLPLHANGDYIAALALQEDLAYINKKEEVIILVEESEPIPQNYIKISTNNFTVKSLKKYFEFDITDRESKNYWEIFQKKTLNQVALIYNTKYFKNYCIKLFINCLDEGILVCSSRQNFGMTKRYGTNTLISVEEEMDIIIEAYEEVKKRNSLFELNIIYCRYRNRSLEDIEGYLNECVNLKLKKKAYDDMVIGFDLVGDEILNESKQFAHLLYDYKQSLREEHPDLNFEYYLHSGESISLSNDNLVDCILLKTPRIGHGTNLIHHLYLIDEFKKNEICIECNPLSNQILNYVPDLRLHPIKVYLDFGLKVTINSDDDGVFGTSSLLTFDFFICAFSLNFDLYDFKQVILNSINHSGVKEERKEAIKKDFFENWRKFLDFMIDNL